MSWGIVIKAITIPDTLYSEENMLRTWNDYWSENNKEYIKTPRRTRPTIKTSLSSVSPIYYVAFDNDNVPVGYSGIEANGPFYASAGTYVIPEYQEQGIAGRLVDKKMNKFGSKPAITFINNLEPYWKSFFLRRGWEVVDMDNLPDAIPRDVAQKEIDAYGEDNVLIYNGAVTKSWFNLLKV